VPARFYKAAEVCEATGLQPYVLRSWEKEFPGIGVQKTPDAPRVYRESDVEWVRRIKELVFGEGLTLAGARRRLEDSLPRAVEKTPVEMGAVLETVGVDARTHIDIVRSGLRSILDVLSKRAGSMPVPELPRNGARRSIVTRAKRVAAPKRHAARRKGSSKRKRASA
jgi:DNA-binding transcriptional MerR regulator